MDIYEKAASMVHITQWKRIVQNQEASPNRQGIFTAFTALILMSLDRAMHFIEQVAYYTRSGF